MKIDHIPIGGRFQWKEVTYTKIGPMTATSDAGASVFVPKHAALQPAPGEAPIAAPPIDLEPLDPAKLLAAFQTYHQTVLEMVDETGHAALEAARERFLADIR
jgi:hypothetical protein